MSLQTALGTITPAGLTIAAASDAKIYDGTTVSSAAPTMLGLVGGDTATNLAEAFQSPNVLGTNGSTLAVTGYSLNDGNNGGNYTVSLQTALGTITPAGLTIAAASDAKIYDGTTFSSAAPTVLGLVGGDTAANLAQAFQSKNVLGTNGSTLAVTGYSLNDGNNGANYTVSLQTALGTITPAGLTIAAASDSKIYDGTTVSSAAPTMLGLVGGDTATNLAEAFQSPNVLGTNGSTLAVTGYSLNDGNNGGNYDVSLLTAAGTITPTQTTTLHDFAVIAAISSQPPPPPPPPPGNDEATNTGSGPNPPTLPGTTVSELDRVGPQRNRSHLRRPWPHDDEQFANRAGRRYPDRFGHLGDLPVARRPVRAKFRRK